MLLDTLRSIVGRKERHYWGGLMDVPLLFVLILIRRRYALTFDLKGVPRYNGLGEWNVTKSKMWF